jgi:hypothetical protein
MTRGSLSLARLSHESFGIVVVSLGSDETSLVALFRHDTGIIEPEKSPESNSVACEELSNGHLGEDEVPDERLEETLVSFLDECEHLTIF